MLPVHTNTTRKGAGRSPALAVMGSIVSPRGALPKTAVDALGRWIACDAARQDSSPVALPLDGSPDVRIRCAAVRLGREGEGVPTDPTCMTSPPSTLAAMDNASHLLGRVAERLDEAGFLARRIAAATDWQTPSARAFFSLAEHLAQDVIGLGQLTDGVLGEIALARSRVCVENSWECR